jgi:antitoxin (DNA-binding transcriptional repressor) of toxin-antitoxin stability system
MVAVSTKEFRERADDLLRRVQETGEAVEIFDDGRVIARLVPALPLDMSPNDEEGFDIEHWIQEMDVLAAEIGASVPEGTTALDMINDDRREL